MKLRRLRHFLVLQCSFLDSDRKNTAYHRTKTFGFNRVDTFQVILLDLRTMDFFRLPSAAILGLFATLIIEVFQDVAYSYPQSFIRQK